LYNAEANKGTKLQDKMKQLDISKVVKKITGYVEGSKAHTKVIQIHHNLAQQ